MNAQTRLALKHEAQLVRQFTRSYRQKLADTIHRLNNSKAAMSAMDASSMRCCIEAVDLVLASHEQFAKSLLEVN